MQTGERARRASMLARSKGSGGLCKCAPASVYIECMSPSAVAHGSAAYCPCIGRADATRRAVWHATNGRSVPSGRWAERSRRRAAVPPFRRSAVPPYVCLFVLFCSFVWSPARVRRALRG
jgi:hypothetical protein